MTAKERAAQKFKGEFGAMPSFMAQAPGRVNLIGEHTDYNEGFVLPIAIDLRLYVAFRPRDDLTVNLISTDLQDQDSFSLNDLRRDEKVYWRNYPRGIAWVIQKNEIDLVGMDCVIASDVPVGSGLSSSAAIEIAVALALLHIARAKVDRKTLAKWCQQAENDFIGIRSGIMDQTIALLGKANHALLLDCRYMSHQFVPIPSEIAFIVADTGKPRSLVASEYNLRRLQCEHATQKFKGLLNRPINSLRDVFIDEAIQFFGELPDPINRRARHVVTENERVMLFIQAIVKGDLELAGKLLLASHISLRDDYEVSCPELNAMVEALMEEEGVLGARLTGAGFGGACIAAVKKEALNDILSEISHRYLRLVSTTTFKPNFFAVHPCEGASLI